MSTRLTLLATERNVNKEHMSPTCDACETSSVCRRLRWLGWTLLGNLIGGIGLTTLLRLVRSTHLLAEWRPQGDHPCSLDRSGCHTPTTALAPVPG